MHFWSSPSARLLMVIGFAAGMVQLAAPPARTTVVQQIERPAPMVFSRTTLVLARAPIGEPLASEQELLQQCLLVPPKNEPATDDQKKRPAKSEKKMVACG